jgi:tetratricopeptide (TPR) repeat protein
LSLKSFAEGLIMQTLLNPPASKKKSKRDLAQLEFDKGFACHQQGQFEQSKARYLQALAHDPSHVDALHLMGVLSFQDKQYAQAVDWIHQAIQVDPRHAHVHVNLGNAYKELGELDAALKYYQQAIELNPHSVSAHNNMGLVQRAMGWPEQALQSFERALDLQPNLADLHNHKGLTLSDLQQHEDALKSHIKATELAPNDVKAYNNIGLLLQGLNCTSEAIVWYEQAIQINPGYAAAHNNLGNAHRDLGRFEEAKACYQKALEIAPDYLEAHTNLGGVYKCLQDVKAALNQFDLALALKPNQPDVLWNKSLALLLDGQLRAGFELYEARWRAEKTGLKLPPMPAPLWLGQENVSGKTVLVHSEQGLGDCIQFCRYVPLLKAQGATVVMVVPKALLSVLGGLGADQVIEAGQPLPPHDFHCPMMSLPLAFKTELDTIPLAQGYLQADPAKSQAWRKRIPISGRLKVGVVWNGGFRADNPDLWSANARRNIELKDFAQALSGLEVDFYSLQKGDPAESEIQGREQEFWPQGNFHNFASELQDFSDTAALVDNLDLVVAVDTSTAHLAAAMGKPTWILNRYDTDWRWLLGREDSPWYHSVRQFRQDIQRDWLTVVHRVAMQIQVVTACAGPKEPNYVIGNHEPHDL